MDRFPKYERAGAYHWTQATASWNNPAYNAPLAARYSALMSFVPSSARLVLDAGCGDAFVLHQLRRRGYQRVVGVDADPVGVQVARNQLRSLGTQALCHVSRGSLYSLPFPQQTFDCVVMADVIEHLDRPLPALEEVARVLSIRGALVLTTPNWQRDRTWDNLHV